MHEPLRLEYACTPDELKQAQELQFTAQVGRGSKWRAVASLLIVFGILGMVLFLKFRAIPPAVQPCLLLAVVAIISFLIVVQFFRRKQASQEQDEDLKCLFEITPREVRLAGPTGWAIVPWNGFGKLVESDTLFVLPDTPKRVFPDEQARTWFREQAQRAGTTVSSPAEALPDEDSPAEGGSVRVEVLLRLSDYLDRALASWKLRSIMIFIGVLFGGAYLYATFQPPPPNPAFTEVEVFFYFVLPFFIVLELVVFLTGALHTWLHHRHLLKTQIITLSPAGVSYSQSDGRASTEWTANAQYKETPWSFFLWWQETGVWFQIPKRTFVSVHDADRCRELLARHAKQTTWYFG